MLRAPGCADGEELAVRIADREDVTRIATGLAVGADDRIITAPDGSRTPVAHAARNPAVCRCRNAAGTRMDTPLPTIASAG